MPKASALGSSRVFNYFGFPISSLADLSLDEIKFYDEALSQANVQLDMNNPGIATNVCS